MFKLENSKIFTFYITLLLILTSGTALVGRVYYIPSTIILFLSSLLLIKFTFRKVSILLLLILCFVFISNFLLTGNNDYSSYLTAFIKIVSVFFIFNTINLKLLTKYFVFILAFICFISLGFYTFGLVAPTYIRSTIPVTEAWGNPLRITPLYVYKFWEMSRNNGLWWEPGAFHVFINAAVYFMDKLNFKNRTRKLFNVIFFVTIITTFSTTAYFVYALIILPKAVKWIKQVNFVKVLIALYFLVTIFLIEEMTYGAIVNKFNEQDASYQSFDRRSYDLQVTLDLIGHKPVLGWGYGNTDMFKGYDYQDSSNGLLMLGAEFGMPILILYLTFIALVIYKYSSSKVEFIAILTCFVIISMSQDMLWFPLFLSLFFIPGIITLQKTNLARTLPIAHI